MDRKTIAIFATIAIILLGAVAFVVINSQKNAKNDSESQVTPTAALIQPSSETKTYKDAAGIEFSYPSDLELATEEATDEAIYTHLTITSSDVEGNSSIKAEDTKLKTVEAWLKEQKIETDESELTKIAELEGRTVSNEKSIQTILIDQGVLFTITTTWEDENGEKYWAEVHKKLIESFAFVQPEAPAASTNDDAPAPAEEEIFFEGEEVIE